MRTSLRVLSIIALLASCTKTPDGGVAFYISPGIEEPYTRSVIEGSSFRLKDSYGLFVYYSEDSVPMTEFVPYGYGHTDKYNNIKAYRRQDGNWEYTLHGSLNPVKNFFMIEPSISGKTGIAICGYSPWTKEARSIREIPFSVGGVYSDIIDLMWASQNIDSDNLHIIPKGTTETIRLTFKHALTNFRLGFKCDYEGTSMKISSVKIRKAGETELYSGGLFDAVNAMYSSLTPVEEIVFDCQTNSSSNDYRFDSSGYYYLSLLLVPVEYLNDGDYIIEFTFNGVELSTSYAIRLNDASRYDITGENGVEGLKHAFVQGKSYTFEFDFDNYAQISNVSIDVADTWEQEEHRLDF